MSGERQEKAPGILENLDTIWDYMEYIRAGNGYYGECDAEIEEFLENFLEKYEVFSEKINSFSSQADFFDYMEEKFPDDKAKTVDRAFEFLQKEYLKNDLLRIARLRKIFNEKIKVLKKAVKNLPTEIDAIQNEVKQYSRCVCKEELEEMIEALKTKKNDVYL